MKASRAALVVTTGYPDVALDMISTRTFDARIELLEYVPTILAGPPGTNTVNT
jgi:hypothetical protein